MIIKIISCVLVAVSVLGACCSKLMLKMRRKYFVLLWIYRLFLFLHQFQYLQIATVILWYCYS